MAETAKIQTLRNHDTGEAIAPRTVAGAVVPEDGEYVEGVEETLRGLVGV